MKLGTHMGNGWVYRVYRNQAAVLIRPFISSFFLLSNFQTLNFFATLFSGTVRPRRLKLGTHVDSGQIYRCSYLSLYFFIFLFQTLKFFVTLFSGTVRPKIIKLGTIVDKWVNVSCIPEWGCCRLFVPLFLHFSFSPIIKL